MKQSIFALKLLIFSCIFSLAYSHNFDPKNVRLLDHQQDTYVFRGNLPILNNQDFAYDKLMSTFEEILGYKLPAGIELYDVSLLSPCNNHHEIKIEQDFFENHPEAGCFINHPIYGQLFTPIDLSSQEIAFALKHSFFLDNLKHLIHTIHHDYVRPGKQRVIYLHSLSGHSRVGEVAGSYLMHFKGDSFQTVKNINTQIAGKNIDTKSETEMEWYAYYLKDIRKIDVGPITSSDTSEK